MATTKGRSRLTDAAATGLRDLPTNMAWLAAKALHPVKGEHVPRVGRLTSRLSEAAHTATGSTGVTVSGARQKLEGGAKRLMAEAVPGANDSVSDLMRKAESAADHARDLETAAVSQAQRANDDAAGAARIAEEADQALEKASSEAQQMVKDRVEHAEREAAEAISQLVREQQEQLGRAEEDQKLQVANLRNAEEAAAQQALQRIETQLAERQRGAQQRAERSQERTASAIREASEALEKAQELANQAAQAAHEAAVKATHEAEELAKQAKERAAEAERRVMEADQVRDQTSGWAEGRQDNGKASSLGGGSERELTAEELQMLRKKDLLKVARDVDVEAPSSTTKPELADVLEDEGISTADLTKRELVRLAESKGLEARASMSKSELLELIGSERSDKLLKD